MAPKRKNASCPQTGSRKIGPKAKARAEKKTCAAGSGKVTGSTASASHEKGASDMKEYKGLEPNLKCNSWSVDKE